MERIENNYSLIEQIREEIFENAEIENTGDEVSNPEVLAENILKTISEFVNQNYEWKGVKK